MTSKLHKKVFYSMQSITGPHYILVSLRFRKSPSSGPYLSKKTNIDGNQDFSFDIQQYVREVIRGVEKANIENNTNIEIEEIELVSNQKFSEGHVSRCAYQLVKKYIAEES